MHKTLAVLGVLIALIIGRAQAQQAPAKKLPAAKQTVSTPAVADQKQPAHTGTLHQQRPPHANKPLAPSAADPVINTELPQPQPGAVVTPKAPTSTPTADPNADSK